MSEHQDWKPIVLNKKSEKFSVTKSSNKSKEISHNSATNKQKQQIDNYSKIDKAENAEKIKTVPLDISREIQQARNAKGMTQKELATKINEQQRVISDYESGRAIPNNQILGNLERVLGIKLRGKR